MGDSVLKYSVLRNVAIERFHTTDPCSERGILLNGHFVRRKELETRSVVVFISHMDGHLKRERSFNTKLIVGVDFEIWIKISRDLV